MFYYSLIKIKFSMLRIKIKNLLLAGSVLLFLTSCVKNFPLDKDLTKKSYSLVNQNGKKVTFPSVINGKTTVIGFIYTHCPDICPMTTHNIYLTQQQLEKDGIQNINYVLLSFDPDRDKPEVLEKFAKLMELNLNSWKLLTGDKSIVTNLLRRFEVRAIPTDSSYSEDGELSYSMMHTDRIALIDKESKLRKYYPGSKLKIPELVNDIKKLGD